jgi:ADP-heptose:LPS heptosyltransferase
MHFNQLTNQQQINNDNQLIHIAYVSGKGLGDGLINLAFANNLRNNGFKVTLYNNFIAQLKSWTSGITIKPWPKIEECDKELSDYDLVIADYGSILGKEYHKEEEYPLLARKYLYLGFGKVDSKMSFDHSERLKTKLSPEKYNKLKNIISSYSWQGKNNKLSQIENIELFCKDALKLETVETNPNLVPPENLNLIHGKYDKRIILHPYSTRHHKNWPLKKFIKLAHKLKTDGFEPSFVSSPDERPTLLKELNGEFPAPLFPTISDLAAYIYESRIFIGNDSGPAHLSSALGLSVISIIYHKRNYKWRPGFSKSVAILPLLSIKIKSTRIWKIFLPVSRVYSEAKKLLSVLET